MHNLQIIQSRGINVLTSKQIAEWYGTTTEIIKKNFSNNREKYIEGKHYIALSGDELKAFKKQVNNLPLVNDEVKKVHLVANRTSHLYLWTEKGALLHAKSLNTDKAWEVYDYLVDYYFRAKEQEQPKPKTYREIREAALAQRRQQASASKIEDKAKEPVDIAPMFRSLISELPVEALDEMEKTLRGYTYKATQLATISILTEKIKREIRQ